VNMQESSREGDQDLTMFMREVENNDDVVRQIMEVSIFKGYQHYRFEVELDENLEWYTIFRGRRVSTSASVSFQIGQIR
jgi:hypothetical protein